MSVIIILLFVSLMISGGFLVAFILNAKSGQFDDTESPAHKILFDDIKKDSTTTYKTQNK